MKCVNCGSEMRRCSDSITEEYKGYSLDVKGISHYQCDVCGEYELTPKEADEFAQALLVEYASARDLLTPSEIRLIRKELGMTQVQFEALLGVSTPTVSRWETGAAAPSRAVCKLMRLYARHPELVACH